MLFLRELSAEELIGLLAPWTTVVKPVFLSIPEISGLAPAVEQDHDTLVNAVGSSTAEQLLEALTDEATKLDSRHDHLARGYNYILAGTIEILRGVDPPDDAAADALDAALARLYPTGLQMITASYQAEAGNTAQMLVIADELKAVLDAVPIIKSFTGYTIVKELADVGNTLGNTEQKRAVAEVAAKQEVITPSEIKRRMRFAAETIETVLRALDRSKQPEDSLIQIRQPVLAAVERARARVLAERAAKKKAEAEKTAEAGKKPADAKPATTPAAPAAPATPAGSTNGAAADKPAGG
jgi:hypothetical protein